MRIKRCSNKLKLNDSAISFEPLRVTSFGFQGLGLDFGKCSIWRVVKERLERELTLS